MYIHEIRISKFRHIENTVIGPFKLNSVISNVFVLAGPNGGGKSSIMELIGYALSDSYSLGWSLSRSFKEFAFEVAIGLNSYEIAELINRINEEIVANNESFDKQKQIIEDNPNMLHTNKTIQVQRATDQHKILTDLLQKIIKYFENNNIYYRSFNYSGGEYEKNTLLYNQIHEKVSDTLTRKLKRPLGFFLKADRSYPHKTFERSKIFNFSNTLQYEHLNTIAFNTSEIQYQDMYDFLVQQRYHYLRNLGAYQHNLDNGMNIQNKPLDPLKEYELLLQKLFPDYTFFEKDEDVPTNLYIKLPSNEVIPFNDLSSGEKEVFFILSFFIRHNVENAIIMIDEPELHLHPELARLLIRNMQQIKNNNQIWLATHNSEIIDEAGRDKVLYISKDHITKKAKIVSGNDEENVVNELKNLFGFSGYIGIAKNLVFLEGDNSSADRKFFTNLIESSSNIKFIPVNGSSNMKAINSAILSILESNLGWMNFFLIRDKDYLTEDMITKYKNHKSGNIFVLERHEIENYLIIPDVISKVLNEIFNIDKSPSDVQKVFHQCANSISASVVRDLISFRANLLLQPEDFSMGKFLNNQTLFTENGLETKIDTEKLISEKFLSISASILQNINESFSGNSIQQIINNSILEVQLSLQDGNWIKLFPGKELLSLFCKKLGIVEVAFQNSIIKELAHDKNLIDTDLKNIIAKIG
ncbi:AAA family ATPase [Flavobacterium oncorhynchi]|uniref:AAA family ATPase n=1 Tax=Flavobacterium oncorhynchi TaxID=728056 RepID=UPI003519E1FD